MPLLVNTPKHTIITFPFENFIQQRPRLTFSLITTYFYTQRTRENISVLQTNNKNNEGRKNLSYQNPPFMKYETREKLLFQVLHKKNYLLQTKGMLQKLAYHVGWIRRVFMKQKNKKKESPQRDITDWLYFTCRIQTNVT